MGDYQGFSLHDGLWIKRFNNEVAMAVSIKRSAFDVWES